MRALLVPVLSLSLASLPACGHEDSCGGHSHDPACLVCLGDENPLTPGTMVTAENGFTIELVSAAPVPFVDSLNQLVVRIRKDGNLVDGVLFDGTTTWYPPGGHGSPLLPVVASTTNPGEYEITSVSFIHPGRWELRFALAAGGDTGSYFMPLCIEDDGVE